MSEGTIKVTPQFDSGFAVQQIRNKSYKWSLGLTYCQYDMFTVCLVVCRYDLGSGAAAVTVGTEVGKHVKVGHLHRVVAIIDGRNGSLALDGGTTVFGSSRGKLSSLNVRSTLYIGRLPSAQFSSV